MSKINAMHTWIETGYELFASEGLEGLQVERLARITGLNKSGYYHYFGDHDTYLEKLMEYHLHRVKVYYEDLKKVQQLDPDYIKLLINYKQGMMFTNQLVRNREVKLLSDTHQQLFESIDPLVSKIFADFIGFSDHMEFSVKYYNLIRNLFHSQITWDNINYPYLRNFMYEARDVIQQAVELGSKVDATR